MIECQNISISYGDKSIVESLNVTIPAGSITTLIGSNGAGKSSLLRVLNGLQKPRIGNVLWNGKELDLFSRQERSRLAGSVYSSFARVEGFTVLDLVGLGRSGYTGLFGKLKQADHDAVERAIEMVGLVEFAKEDVSTLSDGEFRKALLAKLLAQDAKLLFLDEPTSHLDLPAAVEFVQVLKGLAKQGKTIVFSTHQLPLAFKMADQMIVLNGKGEVGIGPPEKMTNHEMICDFLKTDKIRIDRGNLIIDL